MRACVEMAATRGAGRGGCPGFQQRSKQNPWKLRDKTHVEHDRKHWKHQQFGQQQKKCIGGNLCQEDGEWIAYGTAQARFSVFIGSLAQKTRLHHQRRKRTKTPAIATRSEPARFAAVGVKGEN